MHFDTLCPADQHTFFQCDSAKWSFSANIEYSVGRLRRIMQWMKSLMQFQWQRGKVYVPWKFYRVYCPPKENKFGFTPAPDNPTATWTNSFDVCCFIIYLSACCFPYVCFVTSLLSDILQCIELDIISVFSAHFVKLMSVVIIVPCCSYITINIF